MKVRISSRHFRELEREMNRTDLESFCFFSHTPMDTSAGKILLVKDIYLLESSDYDHRSAGFVRPTAEFQKRVLKEVLKSGRHPGLIHTHTFKSRDGVRLSPVDVRSFLAMSSKLPTHCMADLVFDFDFATVDGEFLDPESGQVVKITGFEVLGAKTGIYSGIKPEFSEVHDRQSIIPNFDQSKIQLVKVGIVGLGGNGAQIAQMLACIGVQRFVLVDFDWIEPSNLSRIPFAGRHDVGAFKVDVAARYIRMKNDSAAIEVHSEGIESEDVRDSIKSCHFIFGCVDDDAARKVLNELSIASLISYIDVACEIVVHNGKAKQFGQCRTVLPGETPCLVCNKGIDLERVLLSRMGEEEKALRRAVGYIRGTNESPAAAILQLNTGIASLAVQLFVDLVMGNRVKPYIYFDTSNMRVLTPAMERNERCPVCSENGLLAEGEIYPLQDETSIEIPEACHG